MNYYISDLHLFHEASIRFDNRPFASLEEMHEAVVSRWNNKVNNGDNVMNEQWFLLGDIHGSAQPVHYFYQKNKERLSLDSSENFMILLGDVGANFALTGQRDHKFKSELSKLPFTFICLRGNHEARVKTVMDKNPDGWETISKYDGSIFVEKEFPHIEY